METNEISVVDEHLRHWCRAYILMDSLVKLQHSSHTAMKAIERTKIATHMNEITIEEGEVTIEAFKEVFKTNSENISKVHRLLEEAKSYVPIQIYVWPSVN